MRRHLAWVGLSQIFYFIFQFGNSVLIARLLSPYEMGVYAVALAIVGVIGLFQQFGLSGFVVREQDMTPELQAGAFTINAALSLVLSAAIALASIFGGVALHEPGVRRVLLILAITPTLGIFQFLPEANLERNAKFKALSIIGTSKVAISQVSAVVLAYLGQSYMSLAYSQLLAALFGVAACNIAGRQYVSLRVSFRHWRRITTFGLHMLAISGLNNGANKATDFILAKLLGLSALGLFSRATSLNNLLWDNIHLVTGRVLFVDLANRKRSGNSLHEAYIRMNDMNTVLLWPAFAGLALVSGPFIAAVYGRKWIAAAHPLCLIAVGSMIYVSMSMTWELFVIDGKTAKQANIEYKRAIFSVAAFALGCIVSMVGAAASKVALALFSNALYRPHVNLITDTSARDFRWIYIRNGLIASGAVAPAAILMAVYHASAFTPLPYVIGAIALGIVIWLGLLIVMKHPLRDELKLLLGRFRTRQAKVKAA